MSDRVTRTGLPHPLPISTSGWVTLRTPRGRMEGCAAKEEVLPAGVGRWPTTEMHNLQERLGACRVVCVHLHAHTWTVHQHTRVCREVDTDSRSEWM